ncbi:NAD(P)-binding protein [Mollisia scopiformis]|uniref:NAD(P)-binding protein n=1 Tax=Mollisia scopiformis TaxID=149040 RepID=A0A194X8L2_MOLSC|nr:NAD(P)-binding protein [Mollisia scopiformis]KUJ16513.1 NAD(P)-binding protein [Mollisia scopiformis]
MEGKTIYLVTGANRGIGFGLVQALLLRPNTIVIATMRNVSQSENGLSSVETATGSQLIVQAYSPDSDPAGEASKLTTSLKAEWGISKIDVVIANLGIGTDFHSGLDSTSESILKHFQTNSLSPILLFQKLYPLLSTSNDPKFILISSSLGSIGEMEGGVPSLAYGISKAAANYFVRKVHFEHAPITSVAIHPGWVKTENGQNFADAIGVKEPPMTMEESVEGILKQIDNATKQTTSGSFVSYDGSNIQW